MARKKKINPSPEDDDNDSDNDSHHSSGEDNDKTSAVAVAAQKLQSGLLETNQKVEASLLTSIEDYLAKHHSKTTEAGLDFLSVKNSLLLTYLIELVVYVKAKLNSDPPAPGNLRRLNEMKVALDKTRNLDKKLRYQIDKLLQSENAATFATVNHNNAKDEDEVDASKSGNDDPLQYRPDPKAFQVGDEEDASDNDNQNSSDGDENDSGEEEDEDVDDELKAARQTVASARGEDKKKKGKSKRDNDDDDNGNKDTSNALYKAPRHTAMPYMLDKEDKEAQRQKRELRRMRTSELAQSLRHQYSEQPEQEDFHGGTEYGKQAQAAKRFAEREAEKTRYEEETMSRLVVTRKEKKERKRIMRLEGSNLNGIADLGNLVRDASRVVDAHGGKNNDDDDDRDYKRGGRSERGGKGDRGGGGGEGSFDTERHASGKRKKELLDSDGRKQQMRGKRKIGGPKNSFQSALYGGGRDGGGKSKKKKSSKRYL